MPLGLEIPVSNFARRYLDQGRTEGRSEGRTEGRAEGEAQALLTVLTTRGIVITDEARERISACRDLKQLELWLRRSVTAETVDDLFA